MVKALPQIFVARIASNEVYDVGLKEVLKRELAFVLGKVLGGLGGDCVERIGSFAGGVVLDLGNQRRHKIEVLVDAWKLVQQLYHAVIIFERMHPYPWQPIFAAYHVAVIRLW